MTVKEYLAGLHSVESCLPEGFELHYFESPTESEWRVYLPDGSYFTSKVSPQVALKRAIVLFYRLWREREEERGAIS